MMTTATKVRGLAPKTEDDNEAQEEATLAEHLSQTFSVACSFCGEAMRSPAAVGPAADYNDRFDVAARLVAKGWGVMAQSTGLRKLRPACPICLKRKPRPAIRKRAQESSSREEQH
jgi:hypothetical protein